MLDESSNYKIWKSEASKMPKFEHKIKINPKKSRNFLVTPPNLLSKINRAFTKIAGFSWDGLEVLIERA